MKLAGWALAAGLAAGVVAPACAEPPPLAQVGPQSGSNAARAARSTAPEPALAFTLRSEEDGAPGRAETSAVVLAPSFTETATGAKRSLDDRQLCRTFDWLDGGRTVASTSCYALPISRAYELANRRGIAGALKAAKVARASVLAEEYWSQAGLAFTDLGQTPLTVVSHGDATEFRLGDRTVARLVGSAGAADADERARFVRFAARHLPLHPQVRRALAEASTLPQRIEVDTVVLDKVSRRVLTLSALRRVSAAYPLPAGLASSLGEPEGDPDFVAGVRHAVEAAEGRSHPPTFEAIVARIEDAGSHGRPLEAVLGVTNLALQYPERMKSPDFATVRDRIRPIYAAAMQDPQAARFLMASAASASPANPGREVAARSLADLTAMDAVPFGVFRYVTFANLVIDSRDVPTWDAAILKAMPQPLSDDYWRAIAAYPWTANFYKDCGVAYLKGFDAEKAWLAFDLGRAADPGWRATSMTQIEHIEQQVRADQPDFF